MKPQTLLDSVVFKLTPTRTRYDLVIMASGKTEKITSGLLNPFLVHLKTARDQIAKGGYSITLISDTLWFTKGTIERFVSFVSTPEVLERVSTIESEMAQIEEAIAIQGDEKEKPGWRTVEDHERTRPTGCFEVDAGVEKAIILYKLETRQYPPYSNGSATQVKSSKVQLLRVLDTRKMMLQKEQGMAFARAAVAGFDMYHIPHLISFAECFGASRLMKACLRYMELWKRKHETGELFEVDIAEAMPPLSELPCLNASGDTTQHKGSCEARRISNLGAGSTGKTSNHINTEFFSQNLNSDNNRDQRQPSDPQVPVTRHDSFPAQQPAFPQRSTHASPDPPMYQFSRMRETPYYHSYQGREDPRFINSQQMQRKRHSTDSEDSSAVGVSSAIKHGEDMSECKKKEFQSRVWNKKSGMVLIHNLNYNMPKKHDRPGNVSRSASNSEAEEEIERIHSDIPEEKHINSSESSNKKCRHRKSAEISNMNDRDEMAYGQAADAGNWQAFQSFLLRAEEKTSPSLTPVKKSQTKSEDDVNGNASQVTKVDANNDLQIPSKEQDQRDGRLDSHFRGIECRGGYRRRLDDDFSPHGQENQTDSKCSSNRLTEYEYKHALNLDHRFSRNPSDESFIVPFRSGSQNEFGVDDRATIGMDFELPSYVKSNENLPLAKRAIVNYEPDDLTLMPERRVENGYVGYDLGGDYDVQVPINAAANLRIGNQTVPAREVSGKSDGEKLKVTKNVVLKKNKEVVAKKGESLKLSRSAEAQKRADQVRAFKAELQKEKKEKEEEDIKRLQTLKKERQKRIAARSRPASSQSPSTPKQDRASLPTKVSPSSFKSSKFSDSGPEYSSPLQSLPIRTSSTGSINSQKVAKSKISGTTSGLIRSGLFLPESKKVSKSLLHETEATSVRTKRLSEPKGNNIQGKLLGTDQVHKGSKFSDSGPEHPSPLQGLPVRTTSTGSINTQFFPKTRVSCNTSGSTRSISSLQEVKATSIRAKRLSDPRSDNVHRKLLGTNQVPKKTLRDDPRMKMSAIMQLDKTKLAALPELKIRTSSAPSAIQKPVSNQLQNDTKNNTFPISESIQASKSSEKPAVVGNTNDKPVLDPVIEKNVVMLVTETVSTPMVQTSKEDYRQRSNRDEGTSRTGFGSEYEAATEAAYSSKSKLDKQQISPEVVISMDEPQKSTREPPKSTLDYSGAPSVFDSEVTTVTSSNLRDQMICYPELEVMEQNQGTKDKLHNKELKGFRKLLKFGRKNQFPASGMAHRNSDGPVVSDNPTSTSNNGHTLKNLISRDESPVEFTPPKVTRPFSLMSPFRRCEKKLVLK